jgi:hypothetical protein
MGDVRRRFLSKGRIGRGYRAVGRNGRVLLASDRPLTELVDRQVGLRLQTWHKRILLDWPPEPYGVLLCVRALEQLEAKLRYTACLAAHEDGVIDLALDVGGGRSLVFRRLDS